MSYRIKEVKIPLQIGQMTVFYPQCGVTINKTKGYLWWKKSIEETHYNGFFYNSKKELFVVKDLYLGDVIHCETIEKAKEIIEQYKKESDELSKLRYANICIHWNDEKFVKLHSL